MADTRMKLFEPWFEQKPTAVDTVRVLAEKTDGRTAVFDALALKAIDHVIGLKVIESCGGFPKSVHILKNRLPSGKISRSGFLGEILATEYVEEHTDFEVPIRRLRHRDTRELAMRGDDVVGFRKVKGRVKVMKVEAKSRASLTSAVIDEARTGLANHKGRPNPETLAFIECHLRLQGRDVEAEPIAELQQQSIKAADISHLLFTVSGNDPTKLLENKSDIIRKGIELLVCGCRVKEHGEFIKLLFDTCMKRGES